MSPVDTATLRYWDVYTTARNAMLIHTYTAAAPQHIVLADGKRTARLNLVRHILSRLHCAGKRNKPVASDSEVVFEFSKECLDAERLAS